MLEKIMNLIQGQVSDTVTNDHDVPEDKKQEVVKTTTSSIIESLKDLITPENISMVTSLLGGGKSSVTAAGGSGVAQSVQSNVISNLISKVGLSQGTASGIASKVVPAIMSLFSKKVQDDNDPDFNIGSLISTFTGGGNNSGKGGGIMDLVGSFLGKH